MKYRKKPIVIEATQWFQNGDHPEDGVSRVEGKVVRRYRNPDLNDKTKCLHCKKPFHAHGWIDTLEGGHIVCPGHWIVTGVKGEHYPVKPDIFWDTYELEEIPLNIIS